MNGKIARSGIFDNVWIHSAAHDAGTSLGQPSSDITTFCVSPAVIRAGVNDTWGPVLKQEDIDAALRQFGTRSLFS